MGSFAIQEALLAKLNADAGVQAVLGSPPRIYDETGDAAPAMPYCTIGEFMRAPFDTKASTGMDVEVALHVWSGYRGKKEAEAILQAIHTALHRQTLTVSGHSFVDMQVLQTMSFLDQDGMTRHGVARVRVIVQ